MEGLRGRLGGAVGWLFRALTSVVILSVVAHQQVVDAFSGPGLWVAVGDHRGHLEPCGCDPRSDLGGMLRLANFIEDQRRLQPVTWVSLGNLLPVVEGEGSVEVGAAERAILQVVRSLTPVAVLLNRAEIDRWALSSFRHESDGLPWVLSNRMNARDKIWQGRGVVDHREGVAAYLSPKLLAKPEQRGLVIGPGQELIRRWRGMRAETRKVLLFAGPDDELKAIESLGLFESIVAANGASWDTQPSKEEHEDPSRLVRLRSKDRAVYQVPLGGEGLIIVKGAVAKVLPKVADSREGALPLQGKSREVEGFGERASMPEFFASSDFVQWLDVGWQRPVPDESAVGRALKSFQDGAKVEYERWAQGRRKDREGMAVEARDFAGSVACKSCHAKAFEVWAQSRHSHALETLAKKERDRVLGCVGCHVVGVEHPQGFIDVQATPELAGVGCEVCHGPRGRHVREGGKAPTTMQDLGGLKPKEVCAAACHKPPHSTKFDYGGYWEQIRHSL